MKLSYRFITCKVFFVLILMIRAYSSWKSKIQYLKILEYFLRSIQKKKGCAKPKSSSSLKYVHLCTSSSISEEWHGSDQSVALLRHYWAFSSSIIGSTVSHLSLEISHRFHMGFRSDMLAGQSSTVISWSAKHLEVVLACGQVLKSCWKWKSASP